MNTGSRHRAVLCVKEMETKTKTDTMCYILYDQELEQYILLSQRYTKDRENQHQTRFLCKKRKNVLNYLSTVMDPGNYMTIIMYDIEIIDHIFEFTYQQMDKLRSIKRELIGYDCVHNAEESFDYINRLLKNVKYME